MARLPPKAVYPPSDNYLINVNTGLKIVRFKRTLDFVFQFTVSETPSCVLLYIKSVLRLGA